jgi:hypothetical protein
MPNAYNGKRSLTSSLSQGNEKYQIRAMRAGRGRQFTREAMIKN